MTRPRLWIALMLAGAALGGMSSGQQSSGSGSGSSGSGAAGSGAAPSGNAPASAEEGAASAFGTAPSGAPVPAPAPAPAPSPTPTPDPAPAPDTGGPGAGATPPAEDSANFTLPGLFGRPSESRTISGGLLSRPRFRFTGSVAVGFDDNIFGTPTKQQEFPEQRITVVVRPEQIVREPILGQSLVPPFRPVPTGEFRTVRVPAVTEEIVIPGQRTAPRESSIVSRANVGLAVDFATRRTLFTLDSRLGAEYTPVREREPTQYFGSFGLRFVHKVAPRLQWNGNVDASYSQQPDFTRANTPTTVTAGSYLNAIARTGLEYRWTPRLTAAVSVGYNSLIFSDSSEEGNNYQGVTYAAEARYLISPRLTVLGEGRYSTIAYANNQLRDSSTTFVLGGANWVVTNRLTSTLRAGVAIRDSEVGGSSLSPYFELSLGYRLAPRSQLQYTMQYGFEEPGDSSTELVTFRNGLSYIQYFTPRLRVVASGTVLYSTATNRFTEEQSFTQLAFDTNLGLEYNINRRWTFTGTYSFTTVFSDNEFGEYYRNRLFLGLQYAF